VGKKSDASAVVQIVTQGTQPTVIPTKQLSATLIPFPSASAPPSTPVMQPRLKSTDISIPPDLKGGLSHGKKFAKTLRLTSDQLVH
jgi:hypothetical protein